ncbi:MAG TPA: HAMP domain-containing protein [Gammaproteobacteria bacterium]|nr:HAMP domain-containing protein [Gammaproteobacteria bacterium]
MKVFQDLSIKHKLIVIVVSVSLLSVLTLLTYTTFYEIKRIRAELSSNSLQIAETVGSYAIPDLTFGDRNAAIKTLNTLRGLPNLISAALFNKNRELFARYGQPDKILTRDFSQRIIFKSDTLHIMHPISDNDRIYGYLYMQLSTREQDRKILHSMFVGTILFITIMLFSFLMAIKLQALISLPILKLTDFAKHVQTSHNFNQRIEKTSNDEIGDLYTQFNQLMKSIEEGQIQRDQVELKLKEAKSELELRVKYRTRELEIALGELETFSYSVSHDLRSPLRSIDGFSRILLEDYSDCLDDDGKGYLHRVCNATTRMGSIIDDILLLSQISRADLNIVDINLTELCSQILERFHDQKENNRSINVTIQADMHIKADKKLIMLAFENMIGNAWKYTRYQASPTIEISKTETDAAQVIIIKDNGAGFDMQYSNKLFAPLQRLHTDSQFEGTGIGLATVHRVLTKHGGSIRAEGKVDQGACFWLTLPTSP